MQSPSLNVDLSIYDPKLFTFCALNYSFAEICTRYSAGERGKKFIEKICVFAATLLYPTDPVEKGQTELATLIKEVCYPFRDYRLNDISKIRSIIYLQSTVKINDRHNIIYGKENYEQMIDLKESLATLIQHNISEGKAVKRKEYDKDKEDMITIILTHGNGNYKATSATIPSSTTGNIITEKHIKALEASALLFYAELNKTIKITESFEDLPHQHLLQKYTDKCAMIMSKPEVAFAHFMVTQLMKKSGLMSRMTFLNTSGQIIIYGDREDAYKLKAILYAQQFPDASMIEILKIARGIL